MELILEHDEVATLLREALAARGTPIPDNMVMRVRHNRKKDTMRVVFQDRPDPRGSTSK